jgi:hypothetical protein
VVSLFARRLEAPGSVPRLAVLLCVVVAAVAAALRYPAALSDLNDIARRNAKLSYTDREIAGGNAALPNQRSMYEARARIPSGAPYAVAVGGRLDTWPPLAPDHIFTFAHYFLAPRLESADADWVLCFNCELERNPGRVVWRDDDGNALIRRAG